MAGIRRHHTRRLQFLIVTTTCFLSSSGAARAAHPDDSRWHASATVAAGTKTARLILNIKEAPAGGDSIQAKVSTKDVTTALITPSSQKITGQSANESGFRWIQNRAGPPPLGSDDPGQFTQFVFNRGGAPGEYVLEFSFSQLDSPAQIEVHFTSRMKDFIQLIEQTPGARILGPVQLAPAATLSFDLPQDQEEQAFDIVVPNETVIVELTLPHGRTLRQNGVEPGSADWKVFAEAEDAKQLPFFFAKEISLPIEGTHHFIYLKHALKGKYEIHAQSSATPVGDLRVAEFPLEGLLRASGVGMQMGRPPAAGEVKIHAKPLPFECYAGDKLEVVVELLGDIGTQSPQFEVRLERRPWVSETMRAAKLGPPDPVETLPVEFTRDGERTYRGTVTTTKIGIVRIGVRATGKTAAGQPFTDEVLITNESMRVKPVVAKFLSLDAKAVIAADSTKFDHLDISATLDVIEPGDYLAIFMLRGASGTRLQVGGVGAKARLEKGRQILTASVPSVRIWHELRDGPIEIANVQISRTSPSGVLWVGVPTDGASYRTPAYKRDQWDPGPIFGSDQLNVHGTAPAPSGRFIYVEAEWEVTTPGGSCQWSGSLDRPSIAPVAKDAVYTLQSSARGKLPVGRTKVSLLFEGSEIQRASQEDWHLMAQIHCERSSSDLPELTFALLPPQLVSLNPQEYEPRESSLVVRFSPMRLVQGGFGRTTIFVPQKASHDVQFSLGKLPKGIDAELRIPEEDSKPDDTGAVRTTSGSRQLLIETAAHIAPGRYFIPITALSGDEKTTTLFVLDIDPY
jgi:hypothetical protein